MIETRASNFSPIMKYDLISSIRFIMGSCWYKEMEMMMEWIDEQASISNGGVIESWQMRQKSERKHGQRRTLTQSNQECII